MRTALVRTDRYSWGAIWLHWAIAALVIANLLSGLFHASLRGVPGLMSAHKALGITVLALMAARIAWRRTHRPPPLPVDVHVLIQTTARIAHWLLYAMLLLLPLSGWVMVSNPATLRPLRWFGLFTVPALPVSSVTARYASETHSVLGYVMAALVAIHIAAALRHQLILRDGVLARMMPSLSRGI